MKWTENEINKAIDLIREGKSYKEISKIINRSESSIRTQAFKHGEKSSLYKKKSTEYNCLCCDKIISDKWGRGRRFCSQSCNAKYNNKLRTERKYCLNCSKEVKNKYCNIDCQSQYEKKIIFEKIKNGDTSLYEGNYKKYLIYEFGNKCMNCGWCEVHQKTGRVPIQLEHIDGNSENNKLDNLKLLCPNCHSLTPTYGSLNKGNGRKKRYKK